MKHISPGAAISSLFSNLVQNKRGVLRITCVCTSVRSVFISVWTSAWTCCVPDILYTSVCWVEPHLSVSLQLPPEALTSLPRQHNGQKHLNLAGFIQHTAPRRTWQAYQQDFQKWSTAKYIYSSTVSQQSLRYSYLMVGVSWHRFNIQYLIFPFFSFFLSPYFISISLFSILFFTILILSVFGFIPTFLFSIRGRTHTITPFPTAAAKNTNKKKPVCWLELLQKHGAEIRQTLLKRTCINS